MEKIKLYTESQMKKAMLYARVPPSLKIDFLLEDYTPIKLPSELEIGEQAKFISPDWHYFKGYYCGAKWLLEKIKQQADNGK